MSAAEFNLRAVVRDVLTEADEADPGVIAGMVMARIPKKDRDAALSQAMRLFVRQAISETRTGNAPRSNVSPIRSTSHKVAAIREGWMRRLHDRVHVGGSEWKFLADCTYDDLLRVAEERQELAERNGAWAREYRAMADAVLDADVATFGDLPADTQATILGGVA